VTQEPTQPDDACPLSIDGRWWLKRSDWGGPQVVKSNPAALADDALGQLRELADDCDHVAPMLSAWLLDLLEAEANRRACEDSDAPREVTLAVIELGRWTEADAWSALLALVHLAHKMRHYPSAAHLLCQMTLAFIKALLDASATKDTKP